MMTTDQLPPPTRKAPPVNQTITGNGSSSVAEHFLVKIFTLHYRYFISHFHQHLLASEWWSWCTPVLPQRHMDSQVEAVFITSSNLLFKHVIQWYHLWNHHLESWWPLEKWAISPIRYLIAVSVIGDGRPLLCSIPWFRPAWRWFRPDKPIFALKSSSIFLFSFSQINQLFSEYRVAKKTMILFLLFCVTSTSSWFTKRGRSKRKRVEGVIGNGKVEPEVVGVGSRKGRNLI